MDIEYEGEKPDLYKLQQTVDKLSQAVVQLFRLHEQKDPLRPDEFPKYQIDPNFNFCLN